MVPKASSEEDLLDNRARRYVAVVLFAGNTGWNAVWLYVFASAGDDARESLGFAVAFLVWVVTQVVFVPAAVVSLRWLIGAHRDAQRRTTGVGLILLATSIALAAVTWFAAGASFRDLLVLPQIALGVSPLLLGWWWYVNRDPTKPTPLANIAFPFFLAAAVLLISVWLA